MSVLLLRLAGPMQSWGVSSRFTTRDTGREPSKSGVVGLLCAALGRPRDAEIDDLALLRMGVRVDQEGIVMRDYHTAGKGGYLKASGQIERRNLIVSERYYLADARFLVGLEGDDIPLLEQLHQRLRDPVWPLYLGRKAFVPGEPVWLPDGLWPEHGLTEALRSYPWMGPESARPPQRLRVALEDPNGAHVRHDQPESFAARRFLQRRLSMGFWETPSRKEVPCTSRG
jgi:CRISPR system Cascade subunit CasD